MTEKLHIYAEHEGVAYKWRQFSYGLLTVGNSYAIKVRKHI